VGLAGVVVNDSLLLVFTANRLQTKTAFLLESGCGGRQAALQAHIAHQRHHLRGPDPNHIGKKPASQIP
jgi:hypothetical protein